MIRCGCSRYGAAVGAAASAAAGGTAAEAQKAAACLGTASVFFVI